MRKFIILGATVVAITALSQVSHAGDRSDNNGGGNGGSAIQGQGQVQGQVQGQAQGQSQSSRNTNQNVNANANSNRVSNRIANTNGSVNGTNTNANSAASSSNQSQSVNNGGAGANSNNYTEAGNPVSSATAPSFAIGNCQWAVSGGAQFFGFGASGGGAGLYEFCKGMMMSEHMRKGGRADVAKSLECQHSEFRKAYAEAGTPCRADVPKDQQATTPIVQPAPQVAANTVVPVLSPNCKVVHPGNYITCE